MRVRTRVLPVLPAITILLAVEASTAGQPPKQVRPAVTRGRADIGTAKLYYEVRGSGRPLVLLHGGLSSSVDFEAIIPELSRSFRVITIDRRGHGRSSDSDAPFTYEGMADEVRPFSTA